MSHDIERAFVPPEDDIRLAAYYIWEAEGRPHGRHEAHWFQAIDQLTEAAKRRQALASPGTQDQAAAAMEAMQTAAGLLVTGIALGVGLAMAMGQTLMAGTADSPVRQRPSHWRNRGPRTAW